MKKNAPLLIVCLLLTLFCFCSCKKISKRDKQQIERYKNSPRDSRIIGQWKIHEDFILEYKQDGRLIYAFSVYNKENEVTHYKKNNSLNYFYTESDSIIHNLTVNLSWAYGNSELEETYKIEQDTLYISLFSRPYRSGVRVYNQIKDWNKISIWNTKEFGIDAYISLTVTPVNILFNINVSYRKRIIDLTKHQ